MFRPTLGPFLVSNAIDHAIAVSAAAWKILPLPAPSALCSAELYTFSKTRGTASKNVGWKLCIAGATFLASG